MNPYAVAQSTRPISSASPPETTAVPPVPGLEDDAEGSRVVREERSSCRHGAPRPRGQHGGGRVGRAGARRWTRSACSSCATRSRSRSPRTCRRCSSRCTTSARCARSAGGAQRARRPHDARTSGTCASRRRCPRRAPPGQAQAARRAHRVALVPRRAAGIRIVDWRHAPVSRIFYRYREGDDYEEELGDRIVEGAVARAAQRRDRGRRARARVVARRATFVAGTDGAVVARGGARGPAQRIARGGTPRIAATRLGGDRTGGCADKHLPAIAAMLDEEQYELITRPSAGSSRSRAAPAAARPRSGLHRVAYLASPTRSGSGRSACSSSYRTKRSSTTWGACCRRSASKACR